MHMGSYKHILTNHRVKSVVLAEQYHDRQAQECAEQLCHGRVEGRGCFGVLLGIGKLVGVNRWLEV